MRRIAALFVVPLLLLTAACGGDSASSTPTTSSATPGTDTIDDVAVTGQLGAEPAVDFSPPLSFASTEHTVLVKGPGTGDAVDETSEITVQYLFLDASSGETVDTTWDDGKSATFTMSAVATFAGFTKGVTGAHAGDRVLITIAPDDYNPNGNGGLIAKGDSVLMVVDVLRVTNPKAIPQADVPTLELDKDGHPTGFVPTAHTPDQVGLLGVYTLKKGKGAAVTADQQLTVEYLGQVYPDGTVFDESYSKKKAVELSLSNVIPGWQQGLAGQTVGSRVVLTIPSELGYGSQGTPDGTIPPDADLIFVIDIVKAS
ncbi:MAG: FKBP-type peptidyl-prolyl cis-trans isomerase [Nocardioidaceae bacterium]